MARLGEHDLVVSEGTEEEVVVRRAITHPAYNRDTVRDIRVQAGAVVITSVTRLITTSPCWSCPAPPCSAPTLGWRVCPAPASPRPRPSITAPS